ncbi:MAG TPA: tripartite tricarboxylate transporter TctB family protein [Syntrophorhabdales bacterium]|nr:tripartite tricarboxylate transporter TctB family protein [Syntrophorhabdales bacterium]
MLRILEGPIWLLIGVTVSVWSYRTGLGTFKEPGVGFVAFAAGLFVMAIGALVTVFKRPASEKTGAGSERVRPRFLESAPFKLSYTLALLVFYALFLDLLGYILTTFVVLFGLFFNPNNKRLTGALLASFLSVAVTYLVFEVWLKSQLPRGIFPWW